MKTATIVATYDKLPVINFLLQIQFQKQIGQYAVLRVVLAVSPRIRHQVN